MECVKIHHESTPGTDEPHQTQIMFGIFLVATEAGANDQYTRLL